MDKVFFIIFLCYFNFKYNNYNLLLECLQGCEMEVNTCNFVNYPVYPVGLNISENEALAYGKYLF